MAGFLPYFNQVCTTKVVTWFGNIWQKSVFTVHKLFSLEYMKYTVVLTFHASDSVDMLSMSPTKLHNVYTASYS